jgi:hypothetical protein
MSDEQHRQHLLEQLNQRQLALFLGTDLPREITGLPSRADLARDLARRHKLDESLPLAEVAQRVSQAGNRWEFTSFIRNALDATGKPPQLFHQRIVALVQEHHIETVITTAYDNYRNPTSSEIWPRAVCQNRASRRERHRPPLQNTTAIIALQSQQLHAVLFV